MSKKLNIIIAVLLILAIPATVFAVTTMKSTDKAVGTYSRKYTDRINIELTNTDFTLSSASSGKYVITSYFKLEKTEADFYAMINSFTLNGMEYESIVFTPENDNSDGASLSDMLLPVKNGKAVPVEYRVDITFSTKETKLNPVFVLDYTSGMTMLTSERHQLEIPLSVTIK